MYKALSNYYDLFMRDVSYSKWADFVSSFLVGLNDGVDIACGSGLFTIELKKRGYSVYGVDKSQEMLNKAIENSFSSRVKIDFIKGDMSSFKFIRNPSFVTAICDGVNYLKEPLIAFKNIYSQLKDGGVFIFDISSEYKLRNILANCTFSDTQGDITYIWRNVLDEPKNRLCHELTFFEKVGDLYKKSHEIQNQYIHSTDSVLKKLKDVGFRVNVVALDKLGQQKQPELNDERIYFVCVKD